MTKIFAFRRTQFANSIRKFELKKSSVTSSEHSDSAVCQTKLSIGKTDSLIKVRFEKPNRGCMERRSFSSNCQFFFRGDYRTCQISKWRFFLHLFVIENLGHKTAASFSFAWNWGYSPLSNEYFYRGLLPNSSKLQTFITQTAELEKNQTFAMKSLWFLSY